jgi:WD40 repeat protein
MVARTVQSQEALLLLDIGNGETSESNRYLLQRVDFRSIHPDAAQLEIPSEITLDTCDQLEEIPELPCGVFNSDNTLFVVTDPLNDVLLWDVETLSSKLLLDVPDTSDQVGNFIFTTDGRLIFSVRDCLLSGTCVSSTIYVWELTNGSLTAEIQTDVVRQLIFSPDNTLLAGITDTSIEFYDPNSGELQSAIVGSNTIIWRVAFSEDSRLFFIRYGDETIGVWGVPPENE